MASALPDASAEALSIRSGRRVPKRYITYIFHVRIVMLKLFKVFDLKS